MRIVGSGKTIEFADTPKSFLVLDGQHRVYGFSLATTTLRVPVVIYNGLSRQDESRLFIDINTKQRPVPNELLLDIKKLADYENDQEKLLSQIYESFADDTKSPLFGLMTPSARSAGKISRVTFYAALKPLLPIFADSEPEAIYSATRSYLAAFTDGTGAHGMDPNVTNPTVFRSVLQLFPEAARRVKDRFAADYTQSHFAEVLAPMFDRLKANTFKNPGTSHKVLYEALLKALQTTFTL